MNIQSRYDRLEGKTFDEVSKDINLVSDLLTIYSHIYGIEICGTCPGKLKPAYDKIMLLEPTKIKVMSDCNFKLKDGKKLRSFSSGETYTNANLTDAAALRFLRENREGNAKMFEVMPDNLDSLLEPEATEYDLVLISETSAEALAEMYTVEQLRGVAKQIGGIRGYAKMKEIKLVDSILSALNQA